MSPAVNGKPYFVYLMANQSRMIYTGVTNSLLHRVYQHKSKQIEGFTKKFNMTKLVHFEETVDVRLAIRREKEIKGWLRSKKVALIQKHNPTWKDLAEDWFEKA